MSSPVGTCFVFPELILALSLRWPHHKSAVFLAFMAAAAAAAASNRSCCFFAIRRCLHRNTSPITAARAETEPSAIPMISPFCSSGPGSGLGFAV